MFHVLLLNFACHYLLSLLSLLFINLVSPLIFDFFFEVIDECNNYFIKEFLIIIKHLYHLHMYHLTIRYRKIVWYYFLITSDRAQLILYHVAFIFTLFFLTPQSPR